jgi:hypothetical protein
LQLQHQFTTSNPAAAILCELCKPHAYEPAAASDAGYLCGALASSFGCRASPRALLLLLLLPALPVPLLLLLLLLLNVKGPPEEPSSACTE